MLLGLLFGLGFSLVTRAASAEGVVDESAYVVAEKLKSTDAIRVSVEKLQTGDFGRAALFGDCLE